MHKLQILNNKSGNKTIVYQKLINMAQKQTIKKSKQNANFKNFICKNDLPKNLNFSEHSILNDFLIFGTF